MGWGVGVTPLCCCLGTPQALRWCGALSCPGTGTCPRSAPCSEQPHHDAAGQTVAARHNNTDARGGQGRWQQVNGDTQGQGSGKGAARGRGKTEIRARRTRLYLRRRLHCKRAACTCKQRQGLETTGHGSADTRHEDALLLKRARRRHCRATHSPSLGPPRYRRSETQRPGVGALPLGSPATPWAMLGSNSGLPWGAAQLCPGTREPLADPARHEQQGDKEMGTGAAEKALSIPRAHKMWGAPGAAQSWGWDARSEQDAGMLP